MKKRLLIMLLALATLCAAPLLAMSEGMEAPEAPDAEAALLDLGSMRGSGTPEDPYLVVTEQDLLTVSAAPTGCFSLQNDIAVTYDNWIPIGRDPAFSGAFNGNGHTISGLKMSGDRYKSNNGLFAINRGRIENLTVEVAFSDVAGVAGGLAATNYGTVWNCFSKGTITATLESSQGGLVGYNEGLIAASGSSVNITGVNGGTAGTGGLVGASRSDNGGSSRIVNCYATGSVTGTGKADRTGGLIGYMDKAYARNCYASGRVNDGEGGGLVGYCNSGQIYNSYFRNANVGNQNGFGVSMAELREKDTFYCWDFDNIWEIKDGSAPNLNVRGEEAEIAFTGDGLSDDPYIVTNERQLYALAVGLVSYGEQTCFSLANDIALTAKYWTPIAYSGDMFNATFDGNGHTISGLKLAGALCSSYGLFARISGAVKNLNVQGTAQGGKEYTGLLAGYNKGTIENCHAKGDVSTDLADCGGLIGWSENGTVRNCTFDGSVTGTVPEERGRCTAGLIGWIKEGTVSACGSTATVSGIAANYNGVGGLIGCNNSGQIANCYAQGDVTGNRDDRTGAFIGYSHKENADPIIRNCYASGRANAGAGGGLVGGYSGSCWIFNSYRRASNTGASAGGFPVSLDVLKSQSAYYCWDFENIWVMEEGGYPVINVRGDEETIEFEGEGTEDAPYLIKTEKQLYALAVEMAENRQQTHYKLANDINLTALYWTPICRRTAFAGTFDGDGHTISGLSVNAWYTYNGLFSQNAGTIKNLIVTGTVKGASRAGMLAGLCTGSISNCRGMGDVSGGHDTGGLVGELQGSLTTSCFTGTVTSSAYSVGGLVGYLNGRNSGNISKCYAVASVSSPAGSAGGLVGWQDQSGKVTDCYARGDVSAASNTGGLVSRLENNACIVENCYSTTTVSPLKGNSGGLIGSIANGATVKNSYYDADTARQGDAGKGVGRSTIEMTIQAFYADWDFDTVWGMDANVNGGYPYLRALSSVNSIGVNGVTLNVNSLILKKGDSETLVATVSPANASDKTVFWTTSDATVATVENGRVTATGVGSALITARTADGNFTAVCSVTTPLVSFTDANGQEVNSVEELQGSTLSANVALNTLAEEFQSAEVFLAVYDRAGMMVSLNSWEVNLSNPQELLFIRSVEIPQNAEVGRVKLMILNDALAPVMVANEI